MKKILCFSLVLFVGARSFGQVAQKDDRVAIVNLIKASFDQVWSELDSKKIEVFYTKDFLLLENGEVWNNDSISTYLDHARLNPRRPLRENTIAIIEARITGKTAWIAYHNTAEFSRDGVIIRKAGWVESATFVLTREGWKMNMLHSTRVKNEIVNIDSIK